MTMQLPIWGEEPGSLPYEQDFSDMLFLPVQPESEPEEQTPEEHRDELFHGEAAPEDNFANEEPGEWHRAGRDMTEVCIMTGWPPRHIQVGQHCPHGLLNEEEEIIDYT